MKTMTKTILSSMVVASLAFASQGFANEHAKDQRSDNEKMERTGTPTADRTVGESIDDAGITAMIKTGLLGDDRTQGFDINVDTTDGVVTLTGGADSSAAKLAATTIAQDVEGVLSVDNQLTVAAQGTERRDQANTATASGEVREVAMDAGATVDDAWLTTKVKSMLLADDDIEGMEISVETKANVVHLVGDVPTAAVRNEAIRIANTTEGVLSVDASRLTVSTVGAIR